MFVIWNKDTGIIYQSSHYKDRWDTLKGAKCALAAMRKDPGHNVNKGGPVAACAYEAIAKADVPEKLVEKRCARFGTAFMEDINVPYFCSRSSETYWSS